MLDAFASLDFFRLALTTYFVQYPGYIDAYLRLAASARAQNNLPLAIELVFTIFNILFIFHILACFLFLTAVSTFPYR